MLFQALKSPEIGQWCRAVVLERHEEILRLINKVI